MARGRRRAPKRRTGGRAPARRKMAHGGMHCPPGQTMRGGRCVSSGNGGYRKGGRPTRKRTGGRVGRRNFQTGGHTHNQQYHMYPTHTHMVNNNGEWLETCHYGTTTPWTGKVLMQNGIAYGVGQDGVMAGDSPRLGSCDGYV